MSTIMESGSKKPGVDHLWRLIYIMVIFFIQFGYGFNVGIIGSAMVDLVNIYDSEYWINTYFIMLTSVGYLVGSLTGFLYRWLNRQLVLAFGQLFTAITFTFFPFYGSIGAILSVAAISMVGAGAWDSSTPAWLVELWPERSATLILINLFTMGFGNTVAPILMAPFVHGENTANYTISADQRKHSLIVPCSIAGVTLATACFLLFILYFIKPYRMEDYGSSDKNDDSSDLELEVEVPTVAYRKTKAVILGICVSMYGTFETLYPFYYPSMLQYLQYSSSPVFFSASEAARLTAMMMGTNTAGRLVTSFVALKVTPDKLLVWHYSITLGALALSYFGHTNKTLLYAGTIAIGYGYSALWASILSFAERHINLTPRINSLFTFLLGTSTLIAPQFLGPLIKSQPLFLFLVAALLLITSLLCFVLASILIYFTRFTGKDKNNNKDDDDVFKSYASKLEEKRQSIYQIKVDNRRASVLELINHH